MLASVNSVLVTLVDTAMRPLAGVPPFFSLLLIAFASAVVIVPIIAALSDQARIRRTKRLIHAALFEIRLYNDDPRAVLKSVRDALRHNLTYLRLSLVPLCVVGILMVVVIAHLNPYYGYAGLNVGQATLIKAERSITDNSAPTAISLEAPNEIAVELGPVQLTGTREVLWRIRPISHGSFVVGVRSGSHLAPKSVRVSDEVVRRSPARVESGLWRLLIYPSEPPLDPGPVSAISVTYPESSLDVAGVVVHWSLLYLVFTILWAFVLARVFGVTL